MFLSSFSRREKKKTQERRLHLPKHTAFLKEEKTLKKIKKK